VIVSGEITQILVQAYCQANVVSIASARCPVKNANALFTHHLKASRDTRSHLARVQLPEGFHGVGDGFDGVVDFLGCVEAA
jgi:hypothetical protein